MLFPDIDLIEFESLCDKLDEINCLAWLGDKSLFLYGVTSTIFH